jgi:hypothetical protein
MQEVLDAIEEEINRTKSLDTISIHRKSGFYARPRRFEVSTIARLLAHANEAQLTRFPCSWLLRSTDSVLRRSLNKAVQGILFKLEESIQRGGTD